MKRYKDEYFKALDMLKDVHDEDIRQIEKWGNKNHLLVEWMSFLTEEVGELAQAINENVYRKGSLENIKKEAIQVATLSLKIAHMINRSLNR